MLMMLQLAVLLLAPLALGLAKDDTFLNDLTSSIRDGNLGKLSSLLDNLPADQTLPSLLSSEFAFGTLTPLQYAAKTNAASIDLLISKGSDVNLAHVDTGTTPLMFAARNGEMDAVNTMLAHGADIATVDSLGSTALSIVALTCNYEVAERLIQAGSQVNHFDNAGNNVLHVAAWYCDKEAGIIEDKVFKKDGGATFAKVLMKAIDPSEIDSPSGTKRSALMLSAMRGGTGFFDVLVENGASRTLRSEKDQKTADELMVKEL